LKKKRFLLNFKDRVWENKAEFSKAGLKCINSPENKDNRNDNTRNLLLVRKKESSHTDFLWEDAEDEIQENVGCHLESFSETVQNYYHNICIIPPETPLHPKENNPPVLSDENMANVTHLQ
jgi:hypothetical protein